MCESSNATFCFMHHIKTSIQEIRPGKGQVVLTRSLTSSCYRVAVILITHWAVLKGVPSDSGVLSCAGYYYELDDSYDESDEEEVRAHLRRVAEQPPLKLDDSTEVMQCNAMQ